MKHILPAPGHSSIISFCGTDVTSVSPELFPSVTAAEAHAENIATYAEQLQGQPLRTATFRGADVRLATRDTYQVTHTYSHIGGYCLTHAPDLIKPQHIREINEQIVGLPLQPGTAELATPLHADARHFRVDEDGPVFTGFDPALVRSDNAQGTEVSGLDAYDAQQRLMLTSRAGTLATLILTGTTKNPALTTRLRGTSALLAHYESMLPASLNTVDRSLLGNLLGAQFMPKLLRGIRPADAPAKLAQNPHYIVE